MSVPDSELAWWTEDNQSDKIHCDRNGCGKKATVQVAWRHMRRPVSKAGKQKTQEWRHLACDSHADWWIARSGASITQWVPGRVYDVR